MFLITNPPHTSSGPLGGYGPFGMVQQSFRICVLGGYVPPQVSGGHLVHHMGNFVNMFHPSQGIPYMQMFVHPYMGHMGGGYYPTSQGHGLYQKPLYHNKYF